MAAYVILNGAVLAALGLGVGLKYRHYITRNAARALAVLIALTAVFDNAIIISGIVAYNPAKILGLTLLRAPVEDFAYTIAAAVLIPIVWNVMRSKHGND